MYKKIQPKRLSLNMIITMQSILTKYLIYLLIMMARWECPITFMLKYNPEQFSILGHDHAAKRDLPAENY